ncbi:hypothetical protein EG327_010584 [Venturia inaequalis]|uniref:Myb-like domain-containing protein n=1 Tax=Venturia inaequalis TaxID=5025 RepID=A0A8H3VP12_VENIN|nr:hypothetical protein EG327_010584 [Venturia inaequalis]
MPPWDDHTERHLLLAIIARLNTSGIDWAGIATDVGVTSESARQKFAKIKKRDADIFTTAAAGTGSASLSTPVKPKATPKRGRSKATPAAAAATDDDDDEEMATPAKKAKKSAKKERKESTDEDNVLAAPVKEEDEGV